jgi:hypothetical protein
VKKLLLLVFVCGNVFADSSSLNLNLPNMSGSYASDRIRAGNFECSQAIGGSINVEFGVVGIINQNGPYSSNTGELPDYWEDDGLVKDVGVYGKINIPLNAPKKRLDCNRLYELELEARRIEVMKLKQEIVNLRALRFEEVDNEFVPPTPQGTSVLSQGPE